MGVAMAGEMRWPEQSVIRSVRRSYGYTIRDLARLAGVHETTVRNWELGRHPARWERLGQLMPRLRRTQAYLDAMRSAG